MESEGLLLDMGLVVDGALALGLVVDGALALALALVLVLVLVLGLDVEQGLPINPRGGIWASPARTCHTALCAA